MRWIPMWSPPTGCDFTTAAEASPTPSNCHYLSLPPLETEDPVILNLSMLCRSSDLYLHTALTFR